MNKDTQPMTAKLVEQAAAGQARQQSSATTKNTTVTGGRHDRLPHFTSANVTLGTIRRRPCRPTSEVRAMSDAQGRRVRTQIVKTKRGTQSVEYRVGTKQYYSLEELEAEVL